jgi:hypothetical protein
MRNKLVQEVKPLGRQFIGKNSHSSGISTRSVKTRNEAEPYWIITAVEDDRNRLGCRQSRGN